MRRLKPSSWLKGLGVIVMVAFAAGDQGVGAQGPWTEGTQAAMVRPAEPAPSAGGVQPVLNQVYTWWAVRDEKRIKIRGNVPSEDDRKTVLGMIKANMPELEIDDRMRVAAGGPPKQTWLGAISFALVQMGHLKSGSTRVDGTAFSVQGEARTAAAYLAVKNAIAQLPMGVVLQTFQLVPPVVKPFAWAASYENGAVAIAGNVPTEALREAVLHKASKLFAGRQIVDRMELASGAPSDWASVVTMSLNLLARLDTGKVSIADTALSVEGVAQDKATLDFIATDIKKALPEGYEIKQNIRERPLQQNEIPKAQPQRGPERSLAEPAPVYPA